MAESRGGSPKNSNLRGRAEQKMKEGTAQSAGGSRVTEHELIHELEVHQLELEMQNEELRRAHLELEISRAKYFSLFDLAPVGYFTISEKGIILEANLTGAAMLGVARWDLINRRFTAWVSEDSHQSVYAHRKQVFASRTAEACEVKLRRADGTVFHAQLTSEVGRDPDGDLTQCRTAVVDITDRRRILDDLEVANEELKCSNIELERFAHMASHDLREPLRTVSCFMQLLKKRYKGRLGADADEFIGYAVDGARRMEALVEGLLHYSHAGALHIRLEPADCGTILEETLFNLKAAIEESRAEIKHDSLPRIMADKDQIVSVFQNLIGNAIKFRGLERPRVHISAARDDGEWVFSMRDNGIGIDPECKDRIFLVSQRLNPDDTYPGTGMGLAICMKIIKRHGGRIWVESKPGKGSTFYFTLPVMPEVAPPQLTDDAAAPQTSTAPDFS
ncbi:MAG: ATP-binding protein [Candidatus Eisenbacteria bacterium]